MCGCCGAPHIIVSRTGYCCRESRKKACNNTVAISRKRIESRVFAALRSAFLSPELIARFEESLDVERKKVADGSLDGELCCFRTALKKAEAGRANILAAIAEGAPYAAFKGKADTLAAEITALNDRISSIETQLASQALPQEDARGVYQRVLQEMDQLLADPDLVDEANSYLKMLVDRVTLTPDENAQHGLEAVMELSSDALLPMPQDGENAQAHACKVFC